MYRYLADGEGRIMSPYTTERRVIVEITEVRIKLAGKGGKRLKGFCSITLDDCFVVRDLRVINGPEGLFVAMPSRKLTAHCRRCTSKNTLDAEYCSKCGEPNPCKVTGEEEPWRERTYCEIAHPINSACRHMIHDCVMQAFEEETRRSSLPDYVCSYENLQQEAPYRKKLASPIGRLGYGKPGHGKPAHGPHPHHAKKPPHSKKDDERVETSFGLGVFD